MRKWWIIGFFLACIIFGSGISCAAEDVSDEPSGDMNPDVQDFANNSDEGLISGQQYSSRVITGEDAKNCRTRLILLGTTGGISWYPETERASSSSVLIVGDSWYIIDMGQGSAIRLSQALNYGDFIDTPDGRLFNGSSTFLEHAQALFFTHLHQDHTADYPSFLLIGAGAGLGTKRDSITGKSMYVPLKVFGPANRGELQEDKTNFSARGGQVIYTDSSNPDLITPTPGTRQMTNYIWQAFAQGINDITLDDGYPDHQSLIEVHEIGGREYGDIPFPMIIEDPNDDPCPEMNPFEVFEDENVRVTATLVDHHQVFPSISYRFDTNDGSIVFSSDTGPDTKGNLQKLAQGADILVHEVIDRAWIEQKFGTPVPGSQMDALKTHMLTSHTANDVVGSVAESCNVTTLVLNHIVPGNTPDAHLRVAENDFSGDVIIGEDMMEIGLKQDVL